MTIEPAPMPTPGPNEVIVKTEVIALNPMDWMIQTMGPDLFSFLQYPFIGGTDVVGEVVEIGPETKNINKGDRVTGLATGCLFNEPREAAFQKFVVLKRHMLSVIPSKLASIDAAVLPMGISTAGAALYQEDSLRLDRPSPTGVTRHNGKTLLIWAGSSSVGSNAIQLAVASGYEVITTCSPRNFDCCKSLGAAKTFDYDSPTVTEDLVAAFEDKEVAGAFAILPGSLEPCIAVLRGRGPQFLATALPCTVELPENISTKFVFATTIKDNEVSKIIFEDFLPHALAKGNYKCAPAAEVVGHGLPTLQGALDQLKGGVSAKKLVVTL